jgi:AraC family transcriptional regulator of arabinose operon
MQENLQGAWSPDTLARAVNLSPSRFQHLFNAEIGMAPTHYLRALRMEAARKLLQTSRLTVKQIINGVGVEDKSHFAREFKEAGWSDIASYFSSQQQIVSQGSP